MGEDKEPEVRQISIKGDAAAAYTHARKTRKRKQSGGFDVPSPGGEIIPTPANLSRVRNMVSRMSGGAAAVTVPPPPPMVDLKGPSSPSAPQALAAIQGQVKAILPQYGGAKPKLILAPKKKSMKKLHLAPSSVSGTKLRSKTRKIRVNLTGMKKRLTRATAIHSDSRKKEISEIKKTLQEAKLLKQKSSDKPDSPEYDLLLRKTYENYMLLRNRAL